MDNRLFLFNSHGDCLKAKLRPGNVHSADGWRVFLDPVLRHYAGKGESVKLRSDAAFAKPELYELCEELGIDYAMRLNLFIMAYNPGNIFRTLALPETIKSWSLRTIQLKLIKLGGRLIKHARYYYLLLAETTINEQLWKGIIQKINKICPAPG